jgi:modification methylase
VSEFHVLTLLRAMSIDVSDNTVSDDCPTLRTQRQNTAPKAGEIRWKELLFLPAAADNIRVELAMQGLFPHGVPQDIVVRGQPVIKQLRFLFDRSSTIGNNPARGGSHVPRLALHLGNGSKDHRSRLVGRRTPRFGYRTADGLKMSPTGSRHSITLPESDNTGEGLAALRNANRNYRRRPWPSPFDSTTHRLYLGDARDLSWIPANSVQLVVTSPPYWTLKKYETRNGQLGDVPEYDLFLDELDRVWQHCARVLVEGGRICCVVGDVCIPRRKDGRHRVMPLHADIQVRARRLGLDCLTPILWHKIANGATEAEGNGAGFYGKPYQPGAVVKNDIEHILFMRKPGEYRTTSMLQKALSMLTRREMRAWFRSFWIDLKGASTREGHPAPFPVELATRLIRMFSFAGDTVLDPFLGVGSTSIAAIRTGRNSVGVEIEPKYLDLATSRISAEIARVRRFGARKAMLNGSHSL